MPIITNFPDGGGKIEIGGRNLLLGTAEAKTHAVDTTEYTTLDPYAVVNGKLNKCGLKVGDKIAISFDWAIKATTGKPIQYGFFAVEGYGHKDSDSSENGRVYPQFKAHDASMTFSADNTSGHVAFSCVLLTENHTYVEKFRIRIDNSVLNFTISNCKLERGTIPTDWTPAPEDLASAAELQALAKRVQALEAAKGA